MFCPALIDPACVIPVVGSAVNSAASAAAGGALSGIAHTIQNGIAWIVASTVDWWVQVPSPDLASEPAVAALQHWMMPVAVAVAVGAVLVSAGKMTLSRKANPLVDTVSGLAVIAATAAVGVLLPSLLLKAGDAWSSWVLAASTGGRFGERLSELLTLAGAVPGVVVILGVIVMVMSAIQAVLMLFRQAALVVLAGVLPLAAAGTLTPATRGWFRRVAGWMLALICYKPAAAAVYATAFTMIGRGRDPRTILMGFTMVLLSLVALPALMKFFTWTAGAVEHPAGGGFLGTVVSGAIAVGALRASGGGISAADQARLLAAQLGPPGGPPPQTGPAPQSGQAPGPVPPGPGMGGGLAGGDAGAGGSVPSHPGAAGSGPAGAPPAAAGTAAGAGGVGAGTAAATPGAAGASAAGSAGAAAGAGAAAAGPAGAVAAGLASGAVSAARGAADAMDPEGGE